MLEKLNQYINDKEFRFTVFDNKIHVINYKRIISLEDNFISFQSQNKKISITGKDLICNKILQNEMLISGIVSKIEVIND